MSVTIHTNSDGLIQKYGTSEAKSLQQGGFLCTYGPYSTLVLNLDLTTLTTSETIQNDVLVIPQNALIESVEFTSVETAATGTAIDIGLIANDRDTDSDITGSITASDPDCLIEAYAAGNAAIGEHERYWQNHDLGGNSGFGTETVGAAVGEILVNPCLITASRTDTTAFTAGKLIVRVHFIPNALSGWGEVH